MFASNGKISTRQIRRLMICNLFGISSLILPEILAKNSGIDGSLAIIAGVAGTFVFLLLLGICLRQMGGQGYDSYLQEAFGKVPAGLCMIFYFIYFVLLSGFAAYTACHLILRNLLRQEPFTVVLLVLLFAGAYGIYGGLEGRVRVYEILFWILAAIFLIMLAFSLGSVDVYKWVPFFTDSGLDFIWSSYLVFGFLSLIFFALFLKPFCAEETSIRRTFGWALLITGVLLSVLYLILAGVFGTGSLAQTPFSAVVLMSMVELPGGFLERMDAIMVGIWFFALYALMDHTIFHSVEILMRTFSLKKKRYPAALVLILVYAAAAGCWRSMLFLELVSRLFYQAAVPLSVLIPAAAAVRIHWKRRKAHE